MDMKHMWGGLYLLAFVGFGTGTLVVGLTSPVPGPFDFIIALFLGLIAAAAAWELFKYLVIVSCPDSDAAQRIANSGASRASNEDSFAGDAPMLPGAQLMYTPTKSQA
tara:strand:+ start:1070 stop:1393 length:324 start_codon:yes stop_codon:yes gene_type:complete